jgi:hypothetical protein
VAKTRTELLQQRAQLLERLGQQRVVLAAQAQPLLRLDAWAQRVVHLLRQGGNAAAEQPVWLAAGVGLLVLARPRRMLRLGWRGWLLWRVWRRWGSLVPKPVRQALANGLRG